MSSKQGNSGVLDLFAGPGGWDLAATRLGLDPLGIEWDDAACATRKAAGLRTEQADVAELDPRPCGLLIASPPCQAWSMAGKRGGERDKQHVIACAMELAAGNDTRAEHRAACEDERSLLVVEPLRWALAGRPVWIAFEQVPPVLELWTLFAQILEREGFSTWAGVLEAERYGVPQTRERAFLMASLTGPVHPPRATHQRYVKGEAQRHDVTLEGEVLPWVSMAEALGWQEGPSPSPSPSVTGGGGETGGVEVFASKAARSRAQDAVCVDRSGDRADESYDTTEPSPTLTARTRRWYYDRRQGDTNPATGVRTMVRPIPTDEPAPTIGAEGLARGRDVWRMEKKEDRPERKAQGAGNQPRAEDEPAATLDTRTDLAKWTQDRPSTTLAGDPRIFSPGGHIAHDGRDNSQMVGRSENAIRVTQQEAATLQTFPPDYPWQGSRSKQFEQIGNAVPPMLAEAVLRALLPVQATVAEAA